MAARDVPEGWVECVPNFSDGRDPEILAALRSTLAGRTDVRALGWHADPDHNRSVATFAGPPAAVRTAAFALVERAVDLIDLNAHRGVHPRLGATDVCPFVPLTPGDMAVCVHAAHELGRELAERLALPVYFYGEAARTPERRALPAVRRGGFEALRLALEGDPSRRPDLGPSRLHPTAGAIAVGARGFLVAFNVQLATTELAVARAIAAEIRESNGGLPGVRALGFALAARGCVQVSINLCAPELTGIEAVFRAVEERARACGVTVLDSELVGLAPRSVLDERIAAAVRLPAFDPRRHVLEEALALG